MILRLEKPIIYLITSGEATDSNLPDALRKILDIVRIGVEEKIALVQIREKSLSSRSLFELTSAVVKITHRSATRLLLNDRADIALAARADGVHLTANSLSADVIRRNFPPEFILGVSTHSFEEAVSASNFGADFAVFGPIFESPGKSDPLGIAALSDICSKLKSFPIIALGGIDEWNYESAISAGAAGIAGIRAFNDPQTLHSISIKIRK